MYAFIIIFHAIVGVLLISVVLLQSGKGSSLANVFGGGGMETVFGAETPAILNKITTILAIVFMVNCFILTIFSTKIGSSSLIQKELRKIPPASSAPAAPSAPETSPIPAESAPEPTH